MGHIPDSFGLPPHLGIYLGSNDSDFCIGRELIQGLVTYYIHVRANF